MYQLQEVKAIIEKFPEAGGVGYVVGPILLKLALQTADMEPKVRGAITEALELALESDPYYMPSGEDVQALVEQGNRVVLVWSAGQPIGIVEGTERRSIWDRLTGKSNSAYVVGIQEMIQWLQWVEFRETRA